MKYSTPGYANETIDWSIKINRIQAWMVFL